MQTKSAQKQLQETLNNRLKQLKRDTPKIIKVETENFIKDNFDKEQFATSSQRWKARKVTSRNPRIIAQDRGRKILYGKERDANRKGGHLRYNIAVSTTANSIKVTSDKPYAKRHNEGLSGMPKRKFIGKSRTLTRPINKKIIKTFKSYK